MSDPDPDPLPSRPRRQGLWLTVGEVVGVLALIVAGLNFWDNHRQHIEDARRAQAQSKAAVAFVATGDADRDGRTVGLRPLRSGQAIQSQRYRFPKSVLDHPVDLTAERPRIELSWVADGLKRRLEASHAGAKGEARVPVVIDTTYVEDADTRTDRSIYQIGFAWKRGFFGDLQIHLTGIALMRRSIPEGEALSIERQWASARFE